MERRVVGSLAGENMIYVLSDVHGNKRRFQSILDQIRLHPEDKLYILGDVVDRHPHGIEIIQWVMNQPNVFMLLGNHEFMMVNALYPGVLPWNRTECYEELGLWYRNGGYVTHDAFKKLTQQERDEIFRF